MSAGKISQEVNHLLEMGLIERAETSKKGKITYCANSAGLVFLSITRYTIGKLNGYKRLYGFTEAIINMISNYKKAIDTLDDAIESLKKKIQ